MYEKPYFNSNISLETMTLGEIIGFSKHSNSFQFLGDCAFLKLENGNNIKVSCGKDRLYISAINRTIGKVDATELPFSNYFAPVRCSDNAPWWTPHIDGINWYFHQYKHCLPKSDDFATIALAVDDYVFMFS